MGIEKDIEVSIKTQIRDHMDQSDYKYIDDMFSEVYQTTVNGFDIYTLKPHPNADDIAMQFYALNGAFFEITSWSYIQKIGRRVK